MGTSQRQGVGRVSADRDVHGLVGSLIALAGQGDVGSRVQVFLPLLLKVRDGIAGEGRAGAGRDLAQTGPLVTRGRLGQALGPQRAVHRRCIMLAVGQDAELE